MMTIGASISLEFLQNFVNPKRVFDPIDICFNCMGSLLSLVICQIFHTYNSYKRGNDDIETGQLGYVNVNLRELSPEI